LKKFYFFFFLYFLTKFLSTDILSAIIASTRQTALQQNNCCKCRQFSIAPGNVEFKDFGEKQKNFARIALGACFP